MGKIIRFPGSDREKEAKESKTESSDKKVKSIFSTQSYIDRVREGIEDYVLKNFAVKKVLGMDVVYKENEKKEIGVIGALAYEHKRRPGTFIAEFIGKGFINKDGSVTIDLLAFRAGEPELCSSLEKIMKAKKILPQIKE
ncbi:hypothetical protein GWK41_09090 [Persephonella atlantica]|uniref:Uncharacterized protein n=1 Tax=Persephonella atlantica TaxID=2699429 RepID=A0ABS1GJV8_9AQUI|nr:hypothetical protein [Persephonella atlantica]MBK3333223.1 hypothetical protein [Persephonella atlantica]